MIATVAPAQQLALAYHAAWVRRDLAGALDCVADDVVCTLSDTRLEGVLAFADYLGAALRSLERTDLCAVFGDETTAVLIRHDQTLTGPRRRVATHVTVQDGRITHVRVP